jgi:DNA polymerase
MNTLIVDFETYFSEADGYSLRKMSMVEYINDPKFEVLGCGVQYNDEPPIWVSGKHVAQYFSVSTLSNTIVMAHNVKFDGSILAWKYGIKPAQWRDTKSMAMAVYGASCASFSLKALSERLGFVPKGELKTDGLQTLTEAEEAQLADYCLTDVEICSKLYNELAPQIPESQWEIMDWTVRAFTEPKLQVNIETAHAVQQNIEERKERLLKSSGLDPKMLASNQQFAKYLESLGYELPMKKSPTGKMIPALALGDPEFLQMLNGSDLRLRNICLVRKEVKKTMEVKRAEKLQAVGKSYPFDIVFSGATQTHRFSGGAGAGGNPQNFPRDSALRRCIESPEGSQLIVGDFKNIELRILAFLCRESKLIKAIREGSDVYAEFASQVYKKDTVTESERQFGKAAILGLGYSMGPAKFKKTVELKGMQITEQMAKQTVYLYRDTYQAVPNFWKICDIVIQMMADGHSGFFPGFSAIKVKKNALVLPSGLELKFPNLRRENEEWIFDKYKSKITEMDKIRLYGGKLTENICQALAGEICKESISRLLSKGLIPSGQVHDELLLVNRVQLLDEVLVDFKAAMTDRLPWWPELLLDVEVGRGTNWYEAKQKPKKGAAV